MVPHPGDHGRFGPLLDRNALGSSDRAAADGRGMIGDGPSHSLCQVRVLGMEVEEGHDRGIEVFDVLGLSFLSSPSITCSAFRVRIGRSFSLEFLTDSGNRLCRCPDALGKRSSAFLLLHDPVIARSFGATSQSSVAGREQNPAFGNCHDFAGGRFYRARFRAGREGDVAHAAQLPCIYWDSVVRADADTILFSSVVLQRWKDKEVQCFESALKRVTLYLLGKRDRNMNSENYQIRQLADEIHPPASGKTSIILAEDDATKVVLFAFAAEDGLAEHVAPFPAIIQIIKGEAELTVGAESVTGKPGTWIQMAAKTPHSITAVTPVVMLLTLQK